MSQIRWVVKEYPGGAKSEKVLQMMVPHIKDTWYWVDVPTETVKVDDQGIPLGEEDDKNT